MSMCCSLGAYHCASAPDTLWTQTHQAKLVLTVIFLEESSNNKVMGGYTELYK